MTRNPEQQSWISRLRRLPLRIQLLLGVEFTALLAPPLLLVHAAVFAHGPVAWLVGHPFLLWSGDLLLAATTFVLVLPPWGLSVPAYFSELSVLTRECIACAWETPEQVPPTRDEVAAKRDGP